MVFSSLTFLFGFLPGFLAVYFLVPGSWKNGILFAGSLAFYFYGVREHPAYLLLMLISVLINYGASRFMARCRRRKARTRWLAAGMIWNMGCLFVFKYLDFFSGNLNGLMEKAGFGAQIPYARLVLPIGISFYTFQLISYAADVYRGERAQKHLISFGVYIVMFPQLIAGPIVRYSPIAK